jgi:hypothetical protein
MSRQFLFVSKTRVVLFLPLQQRPANPSHTIKGRRCIEGVSVEGGVSLVGGERPHLLHEVTSAEERGRFLIIIVDCCVLGRRFFSAGSCKLTILAM